MQGIANATPAAAGELTGKANLNLSVQNAQPAGDAIERLKPVEASIGGVQLRMLGASNPAADALDTTPGALPSVTLPSASGTSGLLRR
ncbi:MAG: hypothetical protein K2P86_04205 [Xanthobacteraceae bacterium]|nr:hypothetical protein [Xanthobacteraceae bacterium]